MTQVNSSENSVNPQGLGFVDDLEERCTRNQASLAQIAKWLGRMEQKDVRPIFNESQAKYQQVSYEFEDIRLNFNYAEPAVNVEISYDLDVDAVGHGREVLIMAKENAIDQTQPYRAVGVDYIVPQMRSDAQVGCYQRAAEHVVKLAEAMAGGQVTRQVLRPGMA